MLNNLYKIKLPFISKNFTNEKSDSYKGFAYFIFQQNDKEEFNNKLIYNTAYITEINRGASNYKDLHLSSNYLTSKPLLKEYRLKSFESSEWLYKENEKIEIVSNLRLDFFIRWIVNKREISNRRGKE